MPLEGRVEQVMRKASLFGAGIVAATVRQDTDSNEEAKEMNVDFDVGLKCVTLVAF